MNKLLKRALYLGIFTIVYNLIEGLVAVYFGIEDDTLALLGFGVDSFVEVISGVGIVHMIWRMNKNEIVSRDVFERTALKITGFAFYLLTAGLLFGSAVNILQNSEPETTLAGIFVSGISLLTMYFLLNAKLKVGNALKSDAIIADANCTKTCFYLSIILLLSSGLYEIFEIGYIDVIGSLGIAYYAFKEGREAFAKSKSNSLACCCDDHCNT
jgi:hypothetical protein